MFAGVHGTGYFQSATTVKKRTSTSATDGGCGAAPAPLGGLTRSRCVQNAHSIVVHAEPPGNPKRVP